MNFSIVRVGTVVILYVGLWRTSPYTDILTSLCEASREMQCISRQIATSQYDAIFEIWRSRAHMLDSNFHGNG